MKFLLISGRGAKEQTTGYFVQEAKKRFSTVLSVPLDKIRIECENGQNRIYYKTTDLSKFHVCYARLFAKDFIFGDVVLDILEQSGVYMPTSADSFQIANHKYYTAQALGKLHIPVPTTFISVSPKPAVRIARRMKYPVVVKLLSGFGGRGVMLAQSEAELQPIADTLQVFKEFISIQQFVKARNEDLRCYVLGEDVKGVRRIAPKGDWRANVSRGGKAQWARLPEGAKEIAVNSAKALGMDVCAVDLLQTDKGLYVAEVNFSPGIIPKFFRRQIAGFIMEYLYNEGKKHRLGIYS
ncbi:MAG: RimK family alpha-L-glutamate ligase [Candidatus Diapherotrites archaeon]